MRVVHVHVPIAVFVGGAISGLPILLALKRPGEPLTRWTIAIAQMLWSALLIHLTGGRIETHFHIFGSLAFLAFYRDWKVLAPATVVVALDHLLRQLFFPESVYGISSPEVWRFIEHAFWVLFEDLFLVIACVRGVREMRSIATQQARIELTDELEKEMEIAARIQTAVLPQAPVVGGLEIAATMVPAADVGGDYYDVLAVENDGCWIGIGDVAGHGLIAGLVMLQTQSATKALILQDPNRSPRDVLAAVNRVLYDNVQHRLGNSEHMTMSLIRYHDDGRFVIAGAHQSLVICRAATGRCECYSAEGTWLGLVEDIRSHTPEHSYKLEEGDLLVLYTDGITEAADAGGELFGLSRLCTEVERLHRRPTEEIRDTLIEGVARWSAKRQDDDATILIVRHKGIARSAAA